MIILTIRTDQPQAEVGLYDDEQRLVLKHWEAHRELSATILTTIRNVLDDRSKAWHDIEGIVFYIGPGSFTGLRIGAAVANTIAATLGIPVAGTNGEDWVQHGIARVRAGKSAEVVVPFYGRDPHITAQKK